MPQPLRSEEVTSLLSTTCRKYTGCSWMASAYLSVFRIYRRKGDHGETFLTVERAAKAVPSNDAFYPQIVPGKKCIEKEVHESNIRLLNMLSYEIFNTIFGQLSMIYRVHCAATCWGRRQYFTECAEIWSTIDLDFGTDKNHSSRYKQLIPHWRAKEPSMLSICHIIERPRDLQGISVTWTYRASKASASNILSKRITG